MTGFRIPGVAISPYARRGLREPHDRDPRVDPQARRVPLRTRLPDQAAPLRVATSAASFDWENPRFDPPQLPDPAPPSPRRARNSSRARPRNALIAVWMRCRGARRVRASTSAHRRCSPTSSTSGYRRGRRSPTGSSPARMPVKRLAAGRRLGGEPMIRAGAGHHRRASPWTGSAPGPPHRGRPAREACLHRGARERGRRRHVRGGDGDPLSRQDADLRRARSSPTTTRTGHFSLDNYISMVSGQAPNPHDAGGLPDLHRLPPGDPGSGRAGASAPVASTRRGVQNIATQLEGSGLHVEGLHAGHGATPPGGSPPAAGIRH